MKLAPMVYPVYKEIDQKERYLESIKNNIIALLVADSEERHKKDLLDICIWQITEIDGKYNTRYRSEGALDKKNWHEVQHEHVFQRKNLVEKILSGRDVLSVINDAVACLVTKDEHRNLPVTLDGWDRYKAAQIKVYDLKEQKWMSW